MTNREILDAAARIIASRAKATGLHYEVFFTNNGRIEVHTYEDSGQPVADYDASTKDAPTFGAAWEEHER